MLYTHSHGGHTRTLHFGMLVAGLVALTPGLSAQVPDTLSGAQRAIALARLSGGQHVRIWQQRVYFLREGQVVSSSANVLTLRTEGRTIEVPASEVDSLWVRWGNHSGKGALIGAIVGGVALGAFLVPLSQANCQGQQHCSAPGAFAFGLIVGGAMGGGVGALIGAAVPKWQRQVP